MFSRFRKWYDSVVRAIKVRLGQADPLEADDGLDNEFHPQKALPGHQIIEDRRALTRARLQGQNGQEIVLVPRTELKPFDSLAKNDVPTNNSTMKRLAAGLAVLMALGLVAGCVTFVQGKDTPKDKKSSAETSPTPAPAVTWKMDGSDHGQNRWIKTGVPAIMKAQTPKEAKAAALVWQDIVKRDDGLLAHASILTLHRRVDRASLVDTRSMATTMAVEVASDLEALLKASTITAEFIPRDLYNTGISAELLTRSAYPSITGNTWGLKVVTPSGEIFYILGRCGNIATPSTPPAPPGKTDNPKPPKKPPLTPKSGDIRDYRRPGDGKERDSGTGVKPPVTVKTPPEVKPPVVIVVVPERVVPKVEPGVNPVDGSDNQGEPLKPQ